MCFSYRRCVLARAQTAACSSLFFFFFFGCMFSKLGGVPEPPEASRQPSGVNTDILWLLTGPRCLQHALPSLLKKKTQNKLSQYRGCSCGPQLLPWQLLRPIHRNSTRLHSCGCLQCQPMAEQRWLETTSGDTRRLRGGGTKRDPPHPHPAPGCYRWESGEPPPRTLEPSSSPGAASVLPRR